jgi:DNA-binding MarR family transcriptional regulator
VTEEVKRSPASRVVGMSNQLRVAVVQIARRVKQLHEEGEATFSETSVLARLQRDSQVTPTGLAIAEHVRPQAIAATLNSLELKDLIQRESNPAGGRRVLVSLTDRGQRALADQRPKATQAIAGALASGFNASERKSLEEAIPLLNRLAALL